MRQKLKDGHGARPRRSTRRRPLVLAAALALLLAAGCDLFSDPDAGDALGEQNGLEAPANGADEPREPPPPLQVLTHFPLDMAEAFADLDRLWDGGEVHANHLPVQVYFNPPHKTTSARKWYFIHPHYATDFDLTYGTVISDWEVYLMADAELTADLIGVETDRDGNSLHGATLGDVDPQRLARDDVDGDPVYLGVELSLWLDDVIFVHYEKLRLRQEIVDFVASQGSAFFPAGTHIGYGANGITVADERLDAGRWWPAVNPLEYFTDELQAELLALFAPAYARMKEEGVHPFRDLAASHLYWDEPGSLAGAWTNPHMPDHGEEETDWWVHISLVGLDYTDPNTYWRVLEHPWNVEHNFTGIYIENTVTWRLYLLDGDLTAGVARIIQEQDTGTAPVWRPQEPESASNHPSVGPRQYLRFEILADDDMWEEEMTIEKFATEEAARAGFTDAAVTYWRGFRYRDE